MWKGDYMQNGHQNKIKFALIGCGAIANKHMIAIDRLEHAEVVGAYDLDSRTAEKFGQKSAVPVFTDVEAMELGHMAGCGIGIGRDSVFRREETRMNASREYAYPYYWAALGLTGDPGTGDLPEPTPTCAKSGLRRCPDASLEEA